MSQQNHNRHQSKTHGNHFLMQPPQQIALSLHPDATKQKPRFPLQQPISTPRHSTTWISNSPALKTNLTPATVCQMNDRDFIDYLQASQHAISTIDQLCSKIQIHSRLADYEYRMQCLEIVGAAQDKINNSILTSLVTTSTDKNKELLDRYLGPRINDRSESEKKQQRKIKLLHEHKLRHFWHLHLNIQHLNAVQGLM